MKRAFVRDARITPSVIKSKARLTYGAVQKFPLTLCWLAIFRRRLRPCGPMAGAFAEDIAQRLAFCMKSLRHSTPIACVGGMDFGE